MAQNSYAPGSPWLVMLYMSGDNNLSEEMVLALQDFMSVGPPKGDKIVAQFDPSGRGLDTQRYDFSDWKPNKTLDDFRLPGDLGEVNAASPDTLAQFIGWAVRKYPARRRLLILSGHGSGTTEDFLMRDDNANDALSISELQQALSAARAKTGARIDIVGMDACYMSMGEVAYAIRHEVDILVGAEGRVPAFGWPYRDILARAINHRTKARRAMKRRELATALVETYVRHYSEYDRTAGRSADLAAIDLRKIDTVAAAFMQLVVALRHSIDHDALLLAHWYAQTYKAHQFVDLTDLCVQIKARFGQGTAVSRRCDGVIKAIAACVIKSGCCGSAYQHSHGLSIYFPWAVLSPDYAKLDFARDTGWHFVIGAHLHATRRAPREGFEVSVPSGSTGDPQTPQLVQTRQERLLELLGRAGVILLAGQTGTVATGRVAVDRVPAGNALADADDRVVQRLRLLRGLRTMCTAFERRLDRAVRDVARMDVPVDDYPREIARRLLRGNAPGRMKSRYTGDGSRYTGDGSRYTGDGSRYTGDGSRFVEDREVSMKNLPPAIGIAFEPPTRTQHGRPKA